MFRRWLRYMDGEITRHKEPRLRNEFVRDALHQMMFARPHGGKLKRRPFERAGFQCGRDVS